METFEIYNLDCSVKNNRKRLLKETMEAIKEEDKPDIELLKKYCKHLGKKYKMKIHMIHKMDEELFISVLHPNDGYVTYKAKSKYEALCKYILLVRNYNRYRKLKVK